MALKEKLIDKAQKLIQKGYLDKAIVEYKAAADADPKDISIRLRIGDLYVKVGKKSEAIKEYNEAARANAQRGFYLKAIAVYKQIVKVEDSIDTRNKLAELYIKQRLIADAIGEYSHMVSWFEQRGKSAEVLELLKKMVDVDPENVGVRLKLAELYHKLSFAKDSLSEYSVIFEKLLSAGKLDTAEKIYLSLYNANPSDERIISGLAELYRLKGDDGQRLRFLKALFSHYSGLSMDEEAGRIALDIVRIRPDDPQASRFLNKGALSGLSVGKAGAEQEPFSVAASVTTPAPAAGRTVAPVAEALPEEEIEITIEGFDEGPSEVAAEAAPFAAVPEEAASVVEEKAVEGSAASGSSMDSDGAMASHHDGAAEASTGAGDEIEIDIEELLKGELPLVETAPEEQGAPLEAAQPEPEPEQPHVEEKEPVEVSAVEPVSVEPFEVEVEIEQPSVEEEPLKEAAPVVEPVGVEPLEIAVEIEQPSVEEEPLQEAAPVVEPVSAEPLEEAGIEEALSIISTELMETGAGEPTASEPVVHVEPVTEETASVPYAAGAAEAPESHAVPEPEEAQAESVQEVESLAVTGNEPLIEVVPEPVQESRQAAPVVEEAEPFTVVETGPEPEVISEEPSQAQPPYEAQAEVAVEQSAPVETGYLVEESTDSAISIEETQTPAPEPVAEASDKPIEAEPAAAEEPAAIEAAQEEEELAEEDLSSAIQELMEKMEPAEIAAAEAPQAPPHAASAEEYVDLSAELGMEEASKDLAESWGGKESAETFDEFKTGIGNQLSKEDSETHYNLGIAYMEMELYGEASKEFKIALKDARLELDCYTRLGLCAMAENNPEEAAAYYSKGLKAAGRSDEEKKGLMYELALAYESAGRDEDACLLFSEIFVMDPDFRETALKVSSSIGLKPCVPLSDRFIEVEFL